MKYFFYLFLSNFFLKYISTLNNIPKKCIELCSSEGGECNYNLKCKCKNGFTTLFNEENFILCNYQRYNKISAGIIELFIGFGFGHFYCKRYLHGYLQLGVEFISYCLMGCLLIDFLIYDHYINFDYSWSTFYLKICVPNIIIIIFSWQIIDAILFFCGYYKDGNNIDLF